MVRGSNPAIRSFGSSLVSSTFNFDPLQIPPTANLPAEDTHTPACELTRRARILSSPNPPPPSRVESSRRSDLDLPYVTTFDFFHGLFSLLSFISLARPLASSSSPPPSSPFVCSFFSVGIEFRPARCAFGGASIKFMTQVRVGSDV